MVHVVKTRHQSAKERTECEEDDRVSAESSATPLDLHQLDNSLFAERRTRKKLTKKEKRAQVRDRALQQLNKTTTREPRHTELTPQQLEEAQRADDNLVTVDGSRTQS